MRGTGAESCISAERLRQRVSDGLGWNPFEANPSQWLDGIIRRRGQGWVAVLFERDGKGRTLGKRMIEHDAGACEDLSNAVVLSIVLLIGTANGPSSKARQTQPESAQSTRSGRDRAAPAPAAPLKQPATDATDSAIQHAVPPALEERSVAVYTGGLLGYRMLPGWSPGIEVSMEASLSPATRFRLGVLHFPEQELIRDEGSLSLALSSLDLGICVFPRLSDALSPHACASASIGVIHSGARDDLPRSPMEHFWGGTRAEVGALVPVFKRLSLDASVTLWAPWVRWRYQVAGRSPVFQQPWVIPAVGIALRFELW